MTRKHTPGPWKAEQFTRPHGGPDGVPLIGFRVIAPGKCEDGRDVQICEAYPAPHPVAVLPGNAALIAEAPAMLAALRDNLETLIILRDAAPVYSPKNGLSKADIQAGIDNARAILARIDGGSDATP